jgi:fluoroacetyl-CoA thioesterase
MTTLRFTVTDQDTAIALGSGDVPVLATPRVLAWMERATVVAAASSLDQAATTVGVEVWMRHRRASPVGAVVDVEVTEVVETDRGLSFSVVVREAASSAPASEAPASAGPGREVAEGRIVRAVVDREGFLRRL